MRRTGARSALTRVGTVVRPGRRRAAFVVLLPLAALLFAPVSGLGTADPPAGAAGGPWWALPVLALSALIAAATLSTYVPATGAWHRLALGCSPCATVAGLTVVAALLARGSGPTEPVLALASLVLLLAGLGHRLGDAPSCTVIPSAVAPEAGPGRSVVTEEARPARSWPA